MTNEYAALIQEHVFAPRADIYFCNSIGEAKVIADKYTSSPDTANFAKDTLIFTESDIVAGTRIQTAGTAEYGHPKWVCLYPLHKSQPQLIAATARMLTKTWDNPSIASVWCTHRDPRTGDVADREPTTPAMSTFRFDTPEWTSCDILFRRSLGLIPYSCIRNKSNQCVSRELHRELTVQLVPHKDKAIAVFVSDDVFRFLGAKDVKSQLFDYFFQA